MNFISKNWKGLLLCLALAVPASPVSYTHLAEVKAGSNFKLIVHLKNTSKTTAVKNMLFDFNAPTEGQLSLIHI